MSHREQFEIKANLKNWLTLRTTYGTYQETYVEWAWLGYCLAINENPNCV